MDWTPSLKNNSRKNCANMSEFPLLYSLNYIYYHTTKDVMNVAHLQSQIKM